MSDIHNNIRILLYMEKDAGQRTCILHAAPKVDILVLFCRFAVLILCSADKAACDQSKEDYKFHCTANECAQKCHLKSPPLYPDLRSDMILYVPDKLS